MKKIFRGISLEDCLKSASYELNKPKEQLKYRILKQKKSFFKKKTVIEVFLDDAERNMAPLNPDESSGTVRVEQGRIIVKDPAAKGRPAVICRSKYMSIFVDGAEVEKGCEVFSNSDIKVVFQEEEAKREFSIHVPHDKMKAYAEVRYTPKNEYALKDTPESSRLTLEAGVVKSTQPPEYTAEEIKEELSNNKIVYGIIEENLKKVVKTNKKILVAQGKKPVDGEDDRIEAKFKTFADLKEDMVGNVDFKSIGAVNAVRKGDVIAVKHVGTEGENGCDVYGKIIKCQKGKKLKLKAGTGCILKDKNTVEAIIDGKPSVQGNTFYVHQVHEINGDVDLSTGNVKFIGDVVIHGGVKEGMKVKCGNDLVIDREVERADISAAGSITIGGSIVASKIYGGGDNVKKLHAVEHLKKFNQNLDKLMQVVDEIKSYNLLGCNKSDGEIIKILLENKFKILLRLGINIIADLNAQNEEDSEDDIVRYIKTRLMGMGPVSIKNYLELNELIDGVNGKIKYFENTLGLPVNVNISYCQDSNIQSSGSVLITGKGEYVSTIAGSDSIEFEREGSVARGGILSSQKEVRCKIVGSMAGVSTTLQVGSKGSIWADVAYHNTIFKVGDREKVLESPGKNVHAYLKDGNIMVDKFVL
ncbi:DUF342 domain-containing protein [uncultured Clostridium sp.]|uniref:DUF342 domain-containing protein n=1 Tax=uncultured Clostridium sp. TaxID=59620 RepID=UPI0025D0F054|nr:flagellar assembly protein A [uncultured Clostridium sp.]